LTARRTLLLFVGACFVALAIGELGSAAESPLRGTVAYSTRDGDIWVMRADGSRRRQLTHSGAGFDFKPTWSPNGKQLAFQTTRGRRPPAGETNVFVIDVADGHERQLTIPHTFRYGGTSPDWSPDGKWIAFGSARGLTLMSPNGKTVMPLNLAGDCPSWTPGSSRLAYCAANASADAPNQDVFETAIQHPRPRRLASGPGNQFPGPWSPDGSMLAIYSGSQALAHVWIVGMAAAGRIQLTKEPGTQAPSEWLPDGRLLIAASKPGERTTSWYLIRSAGAYRRPVPQLRGAISVAWHEN
jgi:Tol biopolymer transport system component